MRIRTPNKTCSVETGLNLLPKGKILDWTTMKACTHDKIDVTDKIEMCLEG